jgi:hypothetical protein
LRTRRLLLLLLGIAAAVAVLRRRQPSEFVDVQFEDGSSIRLSGGPDAQDLLDDAHAILDAAILDAA